MTILLKFTIERQRCICKDFEFVATIYLKKEARLIYELLALSLRYEKILRKILAKLVIALNLSNIDRMT